MIVMKFGGTSTQDAAAMKNVAQIVHARVTQRPVVVVSAIAQATNLLEQTGRFAAEGKTVDAIGTLQKLFDRHYAIVDAAVHDAARQEELRSVLASSANELKTLVQGISILRELTPRTLDALYCFGELLSSRVITAVLQEQGVHAQWIDTKDFMTTDDNFTRAVPMMDVVEQKLRALFKPLLEKAIVPVTQGFIGSTVTGLRTTMGRESSDYSAAIIGASLEVEDIQIWTDVDGVLTADPRVVADPKKIKVLSFDEAYELSYFGAKVLHPNTMLPAIEKNIPIHIYNSRHPERSGTMVARQSASDQSLVKSVAYKRNMVIFSVVPEKRYGQYILWEHIFSILTKYDAIAAMTATSEYSVSFVLDAKHNIEGIAHEMESLGNVHITRAMGILCVVGSNIRLSTGIADRIFNALARIEIAMISFGASSSSMSIVIPEKNINDAVNNIHQKFFEKIEYPEIFELLE
jgi:aspartate kinase